MGDMADDAIADARLEEDFFGINDHSDGGRSLLAHINEVNPSEWHCGNGKVVRIRRMSNSHLLNSFRWLAKNLTEIMLESIECADNADLRESILSLELTRSYPKGAKLWAEIERRNLQALI